MTESNHPRPSGAGSGASGKRRNRMVMALALAVLLLLAVAGGVASGEEEAPDPGSAPSLVVEPMPVRELPDRRTATTRDQRVPGHYIVVLQDSIGSPAEVAEKQVEALDGEVDRVYRYALTGYSAELSAGAVNSLRADPRVEFVVPEKRVAAAAQSIPTGISRTFASGNASLDIDETDDARIDVDVAVIDSGIDLAHPDLNVVARTDCTVTEGICIDNAGTDEAGHGTHVAGTVGAIDNGVGVVGMAPGARLWSVRVLDKFNGGTSGGVIAGLDWVTKRAATIEVANMSLAGEGREPALDAAIDRALDKGVVIAVAAGNSNGNVAQFWPANDPDVITVSAIADYDGKPGGKGTPTCAGPGNDDDSYWNGNWGAGVDIAAPGVCILSSVPGGGYAEYVGTSMAAPHVAGAAAVLASKSNPNTRADVEVLRDQLVDEASLNWNDTTEDGAAEPLIYLGGAALTAPEAARAGIVSVDGQTVTVEGSLNARGLEPRYQIEYGTTTNYGQTAPAIAKTFPYGTKYKRLEADLTDLKSDVTYYYRVATTTSQGTVYSRNRTLKMSRWTRDGLTNQPPQYGSEWYNDVSCIQGGFCMAVGHTYGPTISNAGASARYLNGQWTYVPMLNSPGQDESEASGVSCTASNACTAVGSAIEEVGEVAFAKRWNGSSWASQPLPQPFSGASETVPLDVSCSTNTDCLAVGVYRTAAGKRSVYSARWKNGAWAVLNTPSPLGSDEDQLDDVSCVSATSCTAVGWHYSKAFGHQRPLIMKWNGSEWTFPTPARATGTLSGVSCTSETFCMAVSGGPASERWNGESWISEKPVAGLRAFLASVSCVAPTYCFGVGGTARMRDYGLGQTWNGTSWSLQAMPEESEAIHRLWSVSCFGFEGCSAVGDRREEGWGPLLVHRADTTTDPASGVSISSGTMNGSIVGKGAGETYSYYFEYGPTPSYGNKTPAKEVQSTGTGSAVEVSEQLTNLDPETEIHFRVVAVAETGGQKQTVYGGDRQFRTTTIAPTFSAAFGSGGSANGQFQYPRGIAVNSDGTLWVADGANHRVQKLSASGEYLGQFGAFGTGVAQFNTPTDVAVTSSGDILVTDGLNGRVQKFNSAGKFVKQIGSYGEGVGQFLEASSIVVDKLGNLYVSDHSLGRVLKFDSAGVFKQTIGGPAVGGTGPNLAAPAGLALDPDGELWVADMGGNRVVQYSSNGSYVSHFGDYGAGPGLLAEPGLVDVDARGKLWIGDRSGRIQKFTQTGDYLTQFGGGKLSEPAGMTLTGSGQLYVSNSLYINRVEIWQLPTPEVNTSPASGVKGTQATVNGTVDRQGLPTTYRFEYGTSTSYGSSVPLGGAQLPAGEGSLQASELLSNLSPGTEYHYRLTATNAFGTKVGSDAVFKTSPVGGPTFSQMAITDPFNGSTSAVSNFSTGWSALGWAGGSKPKGENTASGWRAVSSHPTVNGAFYSTPLVDEGPGLGAVATMSVAPGIDKRWFSLWLDMSSPATARAGYELRFTNILGGSTYNVTLDKWVAGEKFPLAVKASYEFGVGSSFAIADEGGTVSAWTNTGAGFTELLSVADSSFAGGSAGVEAGGNATRLVNFRFGSLLPPAGSTDGALKAVALRDEFAVNELPLSGSGGWGPVYWANGGSGFKTGHVSGGWGPFDSYPAVNGAFRQTETAVDTGGGVAVATTVKSRPSETGRFLSLWANMPSPGTTKSGYELRLTEGAPSSFDLKISRWQNGSKVDLASKFGQTVALGSSVALVSKNGVVSAWLNAAGGGGYVQLLSANDSVYTAGRAGLDGSGHQTRLSGFRSGPLPPP